MCRSVCFFSPSVSASRIHLPRQREAYRLAETWKKAPEWEPFLRVQILATPDFLAASATAFATAGPTLGSNALGMM